jgi:hypothetical protein
LEVPVRAYPGSYGRQNFLLTSFIMERVTLAVQCSTLEDLNRLEGSTDLQQKA